MFLSGPYNLTLDTHPQSTPVRSLLRAASLALTAAPLLFTVYRTDGKKEASLRSSRRAPISCLTRLWAEMSAGRCSIRTASSLQGFTLSTLESSNGPARTSTPPFYQSTGCIEISSRPELSAPWRLRPDRPGPEGPQSLTNSATARRRNTAPQLKTTLAICRANDEQECMRRTLSSMNNLASTSSSLLRMRSIMAR